MKPFHQRIREVFININPQGQSILIGIIVGLFSGLAAVGLNRGLEFFGEFFAKIPQKWVLFFLPGAGIVLTVLILKYIIRDAGGHGVPEVIASISIKGGMLKLRSSFSKLIGSLITISSGGSAGPEAPVVISGAAIGSNIARYFKSNENLKIAVTGSGAAAAIAAIFNAPITGIIFTMEVILGEWTAAKMLPIAISSVTGTVVSRILNGNQIPFAHRVFNVHINDILAAMGLSLVMAVIIIIFIRFLRMAAVFFQKFWKNDLLKALSGGILISGFTFFFPAVKGEGYGLVRGLISDQESFALVMVCILLVIKMAVTALTLNSGGVGGVFAPCLFLGSFGGLLFFQLLILVFPNTHFSGANLFCLIGMAGMISGTMHAPLSGIFLIVEITGGYDAILPLLVVSFMTATLVRLVDKYSIYHHDLANRGILLRPQTDGRILSEIKTEELLEKDLAIIHPEWRLSDLIPVIKQSRRNYFPVEDKNSGEFLGMVYFNDIKQYLFDPLLSRSIIVEEIMKSDLETVSIHDSVADIFSRFDTTDTWSLPVLDGNKFRGLISKATMLDHYRNELKAQTEI
jgi:CIC family chloride channel protein